MNSRTAVTRDAFNHCFAEAVSFNYGDSAAKHWSMHSHSAMVCLLGSFDCGRLLNPKTALSQFRSVIIMGLGLALMEET